MERVALCVFLGGIVLFADETHDSIHFVYLRTNEQNINTRTFRLDCVSVF